MLRSTWKPPGIVDAFTRAFEAARRLYAGRILGWALDRPISVAAVSFALTAGAISLVPLGYVGFEFIPAVDRGEIFLQLTFPTGTPLATTDAAISSLETRIARFPDVAKLTGTSGTYASGFGGPTAEASAGQIHVFLVAHPKRSTLEWVASLNKLARREYPAAKPIAIPATGTGGGNAQPLDYTIVATDDEPERYAPAILAALEATDSATRARGVGRGHRRPYRRLCGIATRDEPVSQCIATLTCELLCGSERWCEVRIGSVDDERRESVHHRPRGEHDGFARARRDRANGLTSANHFHENAIRIAVFVRDARRRDAAEFGSEHDSEFGAIAVGEAHVRDTDPFECFERIARPRARSREFSREPDERRIDDRAHESRLVAKMIVRRRMAHAREPRDLS